MTELQFITQNHPSKEHWELAYEACFAGVRWVQLRVKDVSQSEVKFQAVRVRDFTRRNFGATFILNDDVELAKEVDADGVHVGLNDMPTDEARSILGPDKIIGGTANTIEDVLMHIENGVDYVGVGPLRHTETKKNLSPILGFKGYSEIIGELNRRKVYVPVIAIGAVAESDFEELKKTGVSAVACSGLLVNARENEAKRTIINNYNKIFK